MSEQRNIMITRNLNRPAKAGSYYYLLCMTGKNKGLSYYLLGKRIVLGRSEAVDIQILDGKSSREHAELSFVSDGYILTDLGSQNGIVVNDLKVSQHQLNENDKIIVGQTVFKYCHVVIENLSLVEVEEEDEDDELDVYEEDVLEVKKTLAQGKKKKLIMVAVVATIAILLMPTGNKKKMKSRKLSTLDSMRIEVPLVSEIEDREIRDKLMAYIHRGQREYRENNFFRAIEQFEMALILVPHHGQASFYLQKARGSLKNYIKKMEERAVQETSSLRYRAALNQYCAIIAFLQNYPEDERYIKSEKKISILEEKIGYESGEFKCY